MADGSLPRSNPSAEGVDSKGIIDFLEAAAGSKHEFHSLMVVRHGKVVVEGWWYPYAPDLKHTLYSTSKSFTSTAVGFAVSDGKLKVTDKVISFFPESLPDTVSQNLKDMEVKDLLTMSAGQDPDPTFIIPQNYTNWVKAFLGLPVIYKPGTRFLYNSMASYMLSAIVQKVTGEKEVDYLTPRFFNPLSIKGMDWETDPMGINTGGWGLRLKTEDMAKFGQFYLQNGMWAGKQILPSEWVKEATTYKIDQAPGVADSIRDKSDWMQGYCYQFWRCRHNAFRADGAYGQYIIVFPGKDAVVAITCETADMQGELNLVWKYLLPAFKDSPLHGNTSSDGDLRQKLSSLTVKLPEPGIDSGLEKIINGKKYNLDNNNSNIENITFNFPGDSCTIILKADGKSYDFSFGKQNWAFGSTTLPGPNLLMGEKGYFQGLPPGKTAGIFMFRGPDTLEVTLRYIESPHTETMTCTFDGDKVLISRKYSFMQDPVRPDISGHVAP